MHSGNKIPVVRYGILFTGLCMVFQPIACINLGEAWQALYGRAPSGQNIVDFFSSKYGLGLVGGAIAFTFAGLWYTWKKNAEQQKIVQEQKRRQEVKIQQERDENRIKQEEKKLLALQQELQEHQRDFKKAQEVQKDFDYAMSDLRNIYSRHP